MRCSWPQTRGSGAGTGFPGDETEAGEDTEDAQRALGAEHGVMGLELIGVPAGGGGEAGGHGGFGSGRDIAAGVLQERHEIIAGLAQLAELEVEEATRARPSRPGSQSRFSA